MENIWAKRQDSDSGDRHFWKKKVLDLHGHSLCIFSHSQYRFLEANLKKIMPDSKLDLKLSLHNQRAFWVNCSFEECGKATR